MESTWLALIAFAAGIILGAGAVVLTRILGERSARVLQLTIADVPDGVFEVVAALDSAAVVVDRSDLVVARSPQATQLGIVRGRELANPELHAMVAEVRRSGEPLDERLTLVRGPGGRGPEMHVDARVALVGVNYVLVIVVDRTESLRLDGVRRDFVANVSHELKTPVGAVGLLADALDAAAEDPERVRLFATRLTEESQRLAKLTREIIDLSRLESRDLMSDAEPVDAGEVVREAVAGVATLADAAHVPIKVSVSGDVVVFANPDLVVSAVRNLVMNAVQHSPERASVGIGARRVDDHVEIAVTDRGAGIPVAEQARIFERFYRIDHARSRGTGGTGLGLSIVKHIAAGFGGEVSLWSQPGRGSTFTIRLPHYTPDHEETTA